MDKATGALALAIAAAAALAGCWDGEETEPVTPPVAEPAQARTLAGRYEPNLRIERRDGFWPVSVLTIDRLRRGRSTCLVAEKGAPCKAAETNELSWGSGVKSGYLDYPASHRDLGDQREDVAQALEGDAPGSRAQLYFYVTGRDPTRPVSLQYWFYYPFNYLRAHVGPAVVNTDLHEGDFEGLSMLLSARKHQPVYVWMPRHTGEGERFTWNEGALERDGNHLVGYVGRGSHATYESCGRKFRTAFAFGRARDIPDDFISCEPGDTYELGSTVPAVNLARTWWGCWPGHFGYAPAYGSPLNNIYADGPLSPLFQQKFDLRDPRPCEKVEAPARPQGPLEVLPDPETATALGESGGRLNDLFRSCDEWSQRPPQGSYMVACDPTSLDAFFDSGLEDPGEQGLRILGHPAANGPMVPAVFASADKEAVDRATIRTDQLAHPEIYVAVRDEKKLATAEFPAVTLRPGQRLRLRRDDGAWHLVDVAANEAVVASAPVRISEAGASPQAPAITAAVRREGTVVLRFRGGANPATRLVAFGGTSREETIERGRLLGATRGEEPGIYRLTFADPGREIHFLRVVASLDGALAASRLASVSE